MRQWHPRHLRAYARIMHTASTHPPHGHRAAAESSLPRHGPARAQRDESRGQMQARPRCGLRNAITRVCTNRAGRPVHADPPPARRWLGFEDLAAAPVSTPAQCLVSAMGHHRSHNKACFRQWRQARPLPRARSAHTVPVEIDQRRRRMRRSCHGGRPSGFDRRHTVDTT